MIPFCTVVYRHTNTLLTDLRLKDEADNRCFASTVRQYCLAPVRRMFVHTNEVNSSASKFQFVKSSKCTLL
jgi:hypothetical protein